MNVKSKIKAALVFLPVLVCISCQGEIGINQDGTNLGHFSSLPIIKNYLNQKVASTGFGGKAYCAYEVLDVEQSGDSKRLYAWAVCQEYYQKKDKLEQGTGGSFPVALTIRKVNEKIKVLSHQKPRDGSYYTPDLESMFSKKALVSANSINNERVAKLQNAVKQEAGKL